MKNAEGNKSEEQIAEGDGGRGDGKTRLIYGKKRPRSAVSGLFFNEPGGANESPRGNGILSGLCPLRRRINIHDCPSYVPPSPPGDFAAVFDTSPAKKTGQREGWGWCVRRGPAMEDRKLWLSSRPFATAFHCLYECMHEIRTLRFMH